MSKKGLHDGHRDRMRERVAQTGIESLQAHELLEFLLFPLIPRKNTNDIAHDLIKEFGSLSAVFNADASRLVDVNGMTEKAALYLSSLPDVFRRYTIDCEKDRDKLCGRGKAMAFMQAQLYGKEVEQIYVAALDAHDNLIRFERLSSGSSDSVEVSIRSIVDFALKTKASAILLAHNHPSGNLKPSQGDYMMTREILWTLDGIGVRLQDHYIFSGENCYSFDKEGKIKIMLREKETTLNDGIYFYE